MISQTKSGYWLDEATKIISTHCDEREAPYNKTSTINLLVIHNISLPPAKNELDFENENVEDFFTGQLDASKHPYFEHIADLRVSSHLYIKRTGEVIQFVPFDKRAWHAGVSEFKGRSKCNDFSIGIEMQGTDDMNYTELQYETLVRVTQAIRNTFPSIDLDNIVGHEHIAPGRKTDPGQYFDWTRYKSKL